MVRLKDTDAKFVTQPHRGFNSSMVRLKARAYDTHYTFDNGFNSSMVRLKERTRIRRPLKHLCFNSSMVRLKEHATGTQSRLDEFQFQYGSIKSTDDRTDGCSDRRFQFQYGSIKRVF